MKNKNNIRSIQGFASFEAAMTLVTLIPALILSIGLIDYYIVLRSFDSTINYTSSQFSGKPFAVRSGSYFHSYLSPQSSLSEATEVDKRISFGESNAYEKSVTEATENLRKRVTQFLVENRICPKDNSLDACAQWRHYLEVRYGMVAIDRITGQACLPGRVTVDCGRYEGNTKRIENDKSFNVGIGGNELLRDPTISEWVRGGRAFAYSGAVHLRGFGGGPSETLRSKILAYAHNADDPEGVSLLAIPSALQGTTSFQYYGNPDGQVLATEAVERHEFLAFAPIIGIELQVDISDAPGLKLIKGVPGIASLLGNRGSVMGDLIVLTRVEVWSPRRLM